MRDHDILRITEFKGWYDRGDDEVVPADHFRSCQNIIYNARGIRTRYGSSLTYEKSNLRRVAIYKRTGEAQRLLILNNNYQLYDSTDLTTPILTVSGMTDFSLVVMYNRAYISPHDGVTGLAGEKWYVYSGTGTARAAAGLAPTGFNVTPANSASSGNCEAGVHAIAVCNVTASGFVTKPGGYAQLDFTGGRKLDVSNVQVGGTGTAARLLLGTKTLVDFNGDYEHQDWFFIPDAVLADNTTTSITGLSFFDADIFEDANYLFEQAETIPAGVCGTNYNSRLVSGGENSNQSTARISKKGQPESFSEVEGFANINPGDAGFGIKNVFVHRESLYFCKSRRTYVTSDNGDEAAFWNVVEVDGSVGTECHGVAQILDFGNTIQDISVLATRAGIFNFNGTFGARQLTWKIQDVWDRINKTYFHQIQVAIDPENKRIYVIVPLDGATVPTHLLYGDFSDGLDAKTIKWSSWVFPSTPISIVVNTKSTNQEPVFQYARYSGNVYSYDPLVQTDAVDSSPANNAVVDNWVQFAYLPHENDKKNKDGLYHFCGVLMRARGSGSLGITMESQDAVKTLTAVSVTLAVSPGREFSQIFDFSAGRASVKLRLNSAGNYMYMTKFGLYSKWMFGVEANTIG